MDQAQVVSETKDPELKRKDPVVLHFDSIHHGNSLHHTAAGDAEEQRALRKVSMVVLPVLFLIAIMAYLDKSNVNFAAILSVPGWSAQRQKGWPVASVGCEQCVLFCCCKPAG